MVLTHSAGSGSDGVSEGSHTSETLYITSKHLLRAIEVPVTVKATNATFTETLTMSFSNYGTPVTVAPPPADQVVSLTQYQSAQNTAPPATEAGAAGTSPVGEGRGGRPAEVLTSRVRTRSSSVGCCRLGPYGRGQGTPALERPGIVHDVGTGEVADDAGGDAAVLGDDLVGDVVPRARRREVHEDVVVDDGRHAGDVAGALALPDALGRAFAVVRPKMKA